MQVFNLSPWRSTHHNPLYCVVLHCLFAYPVSTTKMSPSSTLSYYPLSSLSCPPGHLWGGEVWRIWKLATEPGRGQRSSEKYSEASEQQRTFRACLPSAAIVPRGNIIRETLSSHLIQPAGGQIRDGSSPLVAAGIDLSNRFFFVLP